MWSHVVTRLRRTVGSRGIYECGITTWPSAGAATSTYSISYRILKSKLPSCTRFLSGLEHVNHCFIVETRGRAFLRRIIATAQNGG